MTDVMNLTGKSPEEINLPNAPLVCVLCQVAFPPVLSIATDDRLIAIFQESIRDKYPYFQRSESHVIQIGPAGGASNAQPNPPVFNFSDRADNFSWRVALGFDFVTLHTTAYVSRSDFLDRLEKVLRAVDQIIKPAGVARIGLRYINKLTGEAEKKVDSMIKPSIIGLYGARHDDKLKSSIIHSMNETLFAADEGQLLARWGILPSPATYDPNVIPPTDEKGWILDLDLFDQRPKDQFDVVNLIVDAEKASERIYAVFRDMVTKEFLTFHGGE